MWRRSAGLWKPGEGRTERWNKAGMARGMNRGNAVLRERRRGEKEMLLQQRGTERFEVIGLGRK